MSVNPTASQAAAMAAFKSNGLEDSNKKQGFQMPSYSRLRTASAASLPRQKERPKPSQGVSTSNIYKIQSGSGCVSPVTVKPKPTKLTIPTTPKAVLNNVRSPITPSIKSPVNRPSPLDSTKERSFGSVGSDAKSTESWTPDYFNLYKDNAPTFRKLSSQHSNLSSSLAQDMISNVRHSIDSKAIPNNQSQKRLSSSYEPNEMLRNVRNSINSKAKTYSQVEITQKNQNKINEIRESIELKRISNVPAAANFLALSSEDIDRVVSRNSTVNSFSQSYSSSVISAILDSPMGQAPETPAIVVEHHLPESGSSSQPQILQQAQNLSLDQVEPEQNENTLSQPQIEKPNTSQTLLAGNATQGLQEPIVLFENRKGSEASLSSLSVYSHHHSSESLIKENEAQDNKPKRKPPPGMEILDNGRRSPTFNAKGESFLDITSMKKPLNPHASPDCFSSKSLISNADNFEDYSIDGDTDFAQISDRSTYRARRSEDGRFPQFPDLDKHKYHKKDEHRHLFKKMYRSKGADGSANLLLDNEELGRPNELSSRPSTPIISHQNQPVQLKATMRKANKRKDKKLFNENKPWKNHYDLSYITEQERKRYEGVWASNKGNYMSHVVTRLAGVDYDRESTEAPSKEEEASTKAARLSSKIDVSTNDQQNFHDLISTQPTQLIHGLIVKKIWSRSRLSTQTLETIWNLVDFRKDGTLNKPEFIVGMWLVDQCLYGRKLPKKVDEEVWESLGNIGVSVVIKKKGRR